MLYQALRFIAELIIAVMGGFMLFGFAGALAGVIIAFIILLWVTLDNSL